MMIELLKSRPHWLRLGFWKRRQRILPLARSCHWYSEAITQTWQKKFSPEFKCLFDECRFYPENTIFAARFTHVWKGIYLNLPAPNKILEIGSWQGASALIWATLFSDAHITCVDTWQGSDSLDMSNDPEKLFDFNTTSFATRLRKIKSDSLSALPTLIKDNEKFDLIYVDGSHYGENVMMDSILSWQLLKLNGVMIWDDYQWQYSPYGKNVPKLAIDWFLHCHKGEYRLLFVNKQMIIEKLTDNPIPY